jgi:Cu/Ag efflux pump CusA
MTVDRAAADRYGLNVADVEDAIETAIGGKNLTTTIEGPAALPGARPLCARFPREPAAAWARFS